MATVKWTIDLKKTKHNFECNESKIAPGAILCERWSRERRNTDVDPCPTCDGCSFSPSRFCAETLFDLTDKRFRCPNCVVRHQKKTTTGGDPVAV